MRQNRSPPVILWAQPCTRGAESHPCSGGLRPEESTRLSLLDNVIEDSKNEREKRGCSDKLSYAPCCCVRARLVSLATDVLTCCSAAAGSWRAARKPPACSQSHILASASAIAPAPRNSRLTFFFFFCSPSWCVF